MYICRFGVFLKELKPPPSLGFISEDDGTGFFELILDFPSDSLGSADR